MFVLTNEGSNIRIIHAIHKPIAIGPRKSLEANLNPGTAVAIRRSELRGDKLKIEAQTDEEKEVLELAKLPPPRIIHPASPPSSPPVLERVDRDELAQVEVKPMVDPATLAMVPPLVEQEAAARVAMAKDLLNLAPDMPLDELRPKAAAVLRGKYPGGQISRARVIKLLEEVN